MAVRRAGLWTAGSVAALATVLLASGCASTPSAGACADASLSIYFADNSADLTAPARAVIADAARNAARCRVREVEVVGLADYRGPPEPNLTLSRQRAETTARALQQAGLPAPRFSVTAEGDAGAVAAPGVAVPMRREVQVMIRFER